MYLNFHEGVNRALKCAVSSIDFVIEQLSLLEQGTKGDFVTDMVSNSSMPWKGSYNWKNPEKELELSKVFLSANSIVRVVSAFEDFVNLSIADLDRVSDFFEWSNPEISNLNINNDEIYKPLRVLLEKVSLEKEDAAIYFESINYFQELRHCIAHRNGLPSDSFIRKWHSGNRILEVEKRYPIKDQNRPSPQFPRLIDNKIDFSPRHTILVSDTCLNIAKFLNSHLVEKVGASGMVYLGAYHSLLRNNPFPVKAFKLPEFVVSDFMNRYSRASVKSDWVRISLREMGLWSKCYNQHQTLFGERLNKWKSVRLIKKKERLND